MISSCPAIHFRNQPYRVSLISSTLSQAQSFLTNIDAIEEETMLPHKKFIDVHYHLSSEEILDLQFLVMTPRTENLFGYRKFTTKADLILILLDEKGWNDHISDFYQKLHTGLTSQNIICYSFQQTQERELPGEFIVTSKLEEIVTLANKYLSESP